jgi:hypothetical protein
MKSNGRIQLGTKSAKRLEAIIAITDTVDHIRIIGIELRNNIVFECCSEPVVDIAFLALAGMKIYCKAIQT